MAPTAQIGIGTGTHVQTVLVANRGEIACRIVRACRLLGLRSVAVYSDADAAGLHVRMADEAVRIGAAAARDSYLDAEAIVAAAIGAGADAVHPGYGLLSENATFAAAVAAAGLRFVGPLPAVLATMGDKVAARDAARRADVPILPGSEGSVNSPDLTAAAAAIGFPLMVKAVAGGGGRGVAVVRAAPGLADAVARASRQATASFGRGEVYLERYLDHGRHVEVQILADAHGTILQLGDRDCSVQRRHQKLIEEAPAPGLALETHAALADAAVRLAIEVGYVGAGTVEFLLAGGRTETHPEFYFLEMNPRLQVEHGVTELVTGIDIVAEQLRVAAGEAISYGQDAVGLSGHAIEVRVAAEDPENGFCPSPGTVTRLRLPAGPWTRVDFGVEAGDVIPPDYDSLIGKVMAWGHDRDTARRRLGVALQELEVVPMPTTAGYLATILDRPAFVSAEHDTGSLERDWPPDSDTETSGRSPSPVDEPSPTLVVAATTTMRRIELATDRGPLVVVVPVRDGLGLKGPEPAQPGSEWVPAAGAVARSGPTPSGPTAPMDGVVVRVAVAAGSAVDADTVVAVLEAMKMELNVLAGRAGVVDAVLVESGQAIKAGAPLVTMSKGSPDAAPHVYP